MRLAKSTTTITTKEFDNFKGYNIDKTDVILMDIAKAFVTIPHNRLRKKLKWYGSTRSTY